MSFSAQAGLLAGVWWGVGDANPTAVGVVVALVAALALGYSGSRLWRRPRAAQRRRRAE